MFECDECGRFVDDLHQPIGELIEVCELCLFLGGHLGDRIVVWFYGACQVGRLDRFDRDVIVVDGVILRRVDVRGVEIG